jgi:transposase
LTNQLRAILLERGLIFPKGRKTLMRRLDQQPAELNELGTRMQQLVADIRAESAELDKRIEALNDDWPKSPVGTNLPGDWRRSPE